MTIRAVVFDAFGTLVHLGERRHPFRALQTLMDAAGHIKQPTDAARIMTNNVGLAGTAAMFGVQLSVTDLAPIERDLQAELETVRLFPESAGVLKELATRGLKLGLCSNLAAPYALPIRLLLPMTLDAYAWSFEVGALKPQPAIYANVCRQLGCEPYDVLMVGDTSEADLHGPRQIGMRSLLLCRENPEANDDSTIRDLRDVLACLSTYETDS